MARCMHNTCIHSVTLIKLAALKTIHNQVQRKESRPTQPAHRKSSLDKPSPIHPEPDADPHLPTFTTFRGEDWPFCVEAEIYCGFIQKTGLIRVWCSYLILVCTLTSSQEPLKDLTCVSILNRYLLFLNHCSLVNRLREK